MAGTMTLIRWSNDALYITPEALGSLIGIYLLIFVLGVLSAFND